MIEHTSAFWFVLGGAVLAGVGLLHFLLEKLPVTTSLVYLLFGVLGFMPSFSFLLVGAINARALGNTELGVTHNAPFSAYICLEAL